MTSVKVGIFEIVDAPDSAEGVIRSAIEAISFPLERCLPELNRRGYEAVKLSWDTSRMVGNSTGMWYAGDCAIYFSTQFTNWLDDVAFVFVHEVGHMVDTLYLTNKKRQQLIDIFHQQAAPYDSSGYYPHDSDVMHHPEVWFDTMDDKGTVEYPAKIYENWADEFAATFAPDVWNGVVKPGHKHFPRFVHWCEAFDSIRKIVLTEPEPVPNPKPKPPVPHHHHHHHHHHHPRKPKNRKKHPAAWRRWLCWFRRTHRKSHQ